MFAHRINQRSIRRHDLSGMQSNADGHCVFAGSECVANSQRRLTGQQCVAFLRARSTEEGQNSVSQGPNDRAFEPLDSVAHGV